jgi:two-component system, cell cycle sensor histidine kinase and response regulator CckA
MSVQSPDERDEKRIEKFKIEINALTLKIEELQIHQNRFLSIFGSMEEIYFECDLAGNLTYFNPALLKLSGYSQEELMGKNNREYSTPEMSKRMFSIFNEMCQTGQPAKITDYEVFTKDGQSVYFELSAYLIKDAEGKPVGFRGIGRNVTERIKAEKQLRESEERFRRFNEASFSGIIIHDKGKIIDCNAEFIKMSGYEYKELIGMDGINLCSPEYKNKMMSQIQSDDEKPYDIIALKKDGAKIPVEILSKKIPYHEKIVRVAEIRDISERKKAEEALRKSRIRYRQLYKEAHQSEELYQSLLMSSADAVALLDIDQRFQFINPAFVKIFGWSLEELQAMVVSYVPKPLKESFTALMQKVVEDGDPLHGVETQRYTKDGRLLDVSLSASRYLDHMGEPAGILITVRDISESKKFQWHMHQAQKMESLGTLAGGVAHDFNNLLMGIQGRLSLLMLNMDHSDTRYTHLRDIEDYIIQAADLTKQMLGIARSGKYEIRPTDINDLIRKHNRMFGRTRKEIAIHEELATDPMIAEVDQNQIEQVLLNMYVNASHAMPRGGHLYIRTRIENLDRKLTQPHEIDPGSFIKISITDTGIGMDAATQKRVFEPFFTTKKRERGTGLGLASAYGIIKNHGGFINLYSEVGRGTTFNLYLPSSIKTPAQEKACQEEIIEGEGTILLVDDEEMILSVAEEMIKALGYEAMVAKGGINAIDLYRHNKDKIGMIILDLIMPGMSGGEVFDQLKKIDPDVRILLASGYSIDGEASSIMDRGCNGFIQKPFNIQELSKKINEVISSKK